MKILLNLNKETNKRLKFEKIIRDKNTLVETAEEVLEEALNYNREDIDDPNETKNEADNN